MQNTVKWVNQPKLDQTTAFTYIQMNTCTTDVM